MPITSFIFSRTLNRRSTGIIIHCSTSCPQFQFPTWLPKHYFSIALEQSFHDCSLAYFLFQSRKTEHPSHPTYDMMHSINHPQPSSTELRNEVPFQLEEGCRPDPAHMRRYQKRACLKGFTILLLSSFNFPSHQIFLVYEFYLSGP